MTRARMCWTLLWLVSALSRPAVCQIEADQTIEQVFPLLFNGGALSQPGDLGWSNDLRLTNNSPASVSVTLDFFQNGQPYAVGLDGSAPQSEYAISLAPGEAAVKNVTGVQFSSIQLYWARVTIKLPAGVNPALVNVFSNVLLNVQTTTNQPKLLSFGRLSGARSFKSKEQTINAVDIGPSGQFGQRRVVVSTLNSGANPVTVTATLYQGTASKATVSYTVPAMGQDFRFLFDGLTLTNGRVTIVSSDAVYLAGLQFLNEFFYGLEVSDGIYKPNLPPIVAIDTPTEGQSFTSSDVTVSGWAYDPDGNPESNYLLEWSIDGRSQGLLSHTLGRLDVQQAFSLASSVNLGFSASLTGLTNGGHTVAVVVTDALGASATLSKTFTINLPPPLIPQPGTYTGDIDLQNSSPADKIISGSFGGFVPDPSRGVWVNISVTIMVRCPSILYGQGPGPLVIQQPIDADGSFPINGRGFTGKGKFTSSTTFDVRVALDDTFLSPRDSCPAVNLVGHLAWRQVFASGTYRGDVDLSTSSISGVGRIASGSMFASILSNGNGDGIINNFGISNLVLVCNGETVTYPNTTVIAQTKITAGKFSSVSVGTSSSGMFTSSTAFDAQVVLTTTCLPVTLMAHLIRQ